MLKISISAAVSISIPVYFPLFLSKNKKTKKQKNKKTKKQKTKNKKQKKQKNKKTKNKTKVQLQDSIFDVRQLMSELPESCYLTCYNFSWNDQILSDNVQFAQIEGFEQNPTIQVVNCKILLFCFCVCFFIFVFVFVFIFVFVYLDFVL